MNRLLNAIRVVAREEAAETAHFPDDLTPSLSAQTRARIGDRILRAQAQVPVQVQVQDPRRQSGPQPGPLGLAGDTPDAMPNEMPDALASRRVARDRRTGGRGRGRDFILTGGGLVLVAAAAFVMWMRPSDEGRALPTYGISASGGVAEVRGGKPDVGGPDNTTTPTQQVRAESDLRIICRPDSAIEGPVTVRAFLVRGTDVDEVRPVVQLAVTGAVELRLRGADLLGRYHGRADLRVVVGRPGAVQAIHPGAAIAESGHGTGQSAERWLTVPLDLVGL